MKRLLPLGITSIIALTLGLSACTNKPIDQAPLGPVSATGSLIPAEVSFIRRGTHILLIDGKQRYYVESKTESLLSFEGQTVHIEGTAQANTSAQEMPVLLVKKITALKGNAAVHTWEIPVLDLSITTPDTWSDPEKRGVVSDCRRRAAHRDHESDGTGLTSRRHPVLSSQPQSRARAHALWEHRSEYLRAEQEPHHPSEI